MEPKIPRGFRVADGDPERSPSTPRQAGRALVVVMFLFVLFVGLLHEPTSTNPARKVRTVQSFPGVTLHKPAAEHMPQREPSVTLATWEERHTATMVFRNTLVYRERTMVLRTRYHDGSASVQVLAERPTDNPNERRFDLDPESGRSEYITLTGSGVVNYFSWAGQQFMAAFAATIHPAFLTVGVNPVSVDCAPKELSTASKEIVGLFEQLQAFKDDTEFAAAGFAGSYRPWLETAARLHAESSPAESLDQLGFLAGDVMTLGLDYASAGESQPSREAQDLEKTIQAGLALATCGGTPLPENGATPRYRTFR